MARLKLLIIDELGFVPLSTTGAELLFEVFSQRYERGSILVTTNLPFDEWTEVFGSERLAGALLDRLTHHVHILEMNGDSYRLRGNVRLSVQQEWHFLFCDVIRWQCRRSRPGSPRRRAFSIDVSHHRVSVDAQLPRHPSNRQARKIGPLHCLPALHLQKCWLTGGGGYSQLGYRHMVNGSAMTIFLIRLCVQQFENCCRWF